LDGMEAVGSARKRAREGHTILQVFKAKRMNRQNTLDHYDTLFISN
ncbi:unnamed protein product, partial [Allacma fusca]